MSSSITTYAGTLTARERASDRWNTTELPQDELRQLRESLMCNVTDSVREDVASESGDTVCPECMGVNGRHNTLHIRYGNGWGGNKPCPRSKAVNA